MLDRPRDHQLDVARRDAELSLRNLWLRYFAVGGSLAAVELDAILNGATAPDSHDHNQIVHTLNERFAELGSERRLPYL